MTLRVTLLLREYIYTSALINVSYISRMLYILLNKIKINTKRGIIQDIS